MTSLVTAAGLTKKYGDLAAVAGISEAGLGCNGDCSGGTDLFDVLRAIDVVLGSATMPAVPCAEVGA